MRIFLLKLNHGVEIGAHLAYVGHYARTNNQEIARIADEEVVHRKNLRGILDYYHCYPSNLIDVFFAIVGNIIRISCAVSPLFLLNFVARSMEVFAITNYGYLARLCPEFSELLNSMAEAETRHKNYFSR